ncbi:MAG: hypothetical protein VB078_06885 [Clostridiaceae bacterium]|nr:hypothetical protein [Clostridiaceae bacterium]
MAYKKDIDYQALIDAAAAGGDYQNAAKFEQQRNDKITGEDITTQTTTNKYSPYLNGGINNNIDYHQNAVDAAKSYATSGNTSDWQAVLEALSSRNDKINATGNDYGVSNQDILNSLSQYQQSGTNSALYNTIMQQLNQDYSYGGSQWDDTAAQLAQQAIDFNYSDWTNGDQYAALKDRYTQQGQQAMDDTIGMIAARTGGLASSYAGVAGQQQYNDYMSQLESAAMSQYANEKNSLLTNAQLAQSMGESDYQRYLNELSSQQGGNQEAFNMLYQLMGYNNQQSTYADETAYSRGQTTKNDAMNRVYDYLVNQGGSVGDLDAALITSSGYTLAELNAMAAKYQQNAAAAAKSSASKSSGSSSGGTSTRTNKTLSKPTLTAAQTLSALNDGIVNDTTRAAYEYYYGQAYGGSDMEESDNEGTITNRHGDTWIEIPNRGRYSLDEVERYVSSGKIIETYDKSSNSYSYTWNNSK